MVVSSYPGSSAPGLMDYNPPQPLPSPHPVFPPPVLLGNLSSPCDNGVTVPCPFLQTCQGSSGIFLCPDFCWLQSGEGHLSPGAGKGHCWDSRHTCLQQDWLQTMQIAFSGGKHSHHHIFTLFPQLPTPIFNLVSREHEACIYECRCSRDEEVGDTRKTRDSDPTLYYLTLSLYSVPPTKLCCKLNDKAASFNIF